MWPKKIHLDRLAVRAAAVTLLPLVVFGSACTSGNTAAEPTLDPSEPAVAEPVATVAEWKARRDASLRKPDGWLSLVGLEWLKPGRNLVGGAPEADVRLPQKAPATVGWIEWEGDDLRFVPAEADVTSGGEPVESPIPLVRDTEGEPTELVVGSLHFYVIDREGDLAVRVKDAESPLIKSFEGMEYFPLDPSWQLEARFVPEETEIEVPDILGRVTLQTSPGVVVIERGGEEFRLLALEGGSDGSLFLVFGDTTNGDETYGGGRFVYSEPPVGDRVAVDFNKSYNPPCVFTPFATCPLPPASNRFPFPIRAGELMWGEAH